MQVSYTCTSLNECSKLRPNGWPQPQQTTRRHVQLTSADSSWRGLPMTYPDVVCLRTGFSVGDFPDNWQVAYVHQVQVRLCCQLNAGVNCRTINGGFVWTIAVFVWGFGVYTHVDWVQANQCLANRIKWDNILTIC